MKRAVVLTSGLFLLAALAAALRPGPARPLPASPELQAAPQEAQKPNYDYMSTFRSKSTLPLGLKENPALKKMLDQGAVRWAVRAGVRQVLD
jgi:hypothetical protein